MITQLEQRLRLRTIAVGALAGLLAAGALALPSILPAALADEEPFNTMLTTGAEILPDPPLVAEDFFKPDWTLEPSVNTDIVKQQTVRKIGYGRTEFVTIVTTPTGTYSSDAVESPYVRYPGIHDTTATDNRGVELLGLWNGKNWTVLKPFAAHSFVTILTLPNGGKAFVDEDGGCVFGDDGTAYC